jgi:hypothetical protein
MLVAFVFSIAMTNTYLILDVVLDAAFAKDGDESFSGDEMVCAARSDRLQPASPNRDNTAIPPAKCICFRRIMLLSSAKRGYPFSTVAWYLVPLLRGPKRSAHPFPIRNGSEIGAGHFIADLLRACARRDASKGN